MHHLAPHPNTHSYRCHRWSVVGPKWSWIICPSPLVENDFHISFIVSPLAAHKLYYPNTFALEKVFGVLDWMYSTWTARNLESIRCLSADSLCLFWPSAPCLFPLRIYFDLSTHNYEYLGACILYTKGSIWYYNIPFASRYHFVTAAQNETVSPLLRKK